ncbi:MAG: hypothetical protein QW512_02080 [Thermofilaceae archaeon]
MSREVICPRCGLPGKLVEKRTPHNTYIYVVHGRRQCYAGPRQYIYVSRLHDFELHGAHDAKRYIVYLEELVDIMIEKLKSNELRDKTELIKALRRLNEKIERALESSA